MRNYKALIIGLSLVLLFSLGAMAEEVVITWMYPGAEQAFSQAAIEGTLARFAEVHPEIKVEVIDVPWSMAHDRIVSMLLADDLPDLINIGSRWLPELVEMGAALSLEEAFGHKKDMYYPGLVQTVEIGGELYAMPRAYSTQALIYRTDLIPEPPTTWEELIEVAKNIQKENPDMYGFAFGGADHVSTLSQYFTVLFSFGGQVTDADGRLVLNSPEAVEALQLLVDMYREHNIVPNPLEYHREELSELFSAERIAMFISGPWGGNALGLPPENDRIPYNSALVPAGPAGPGTEVVSDSTIVAATTRNKEAALTFLDFITTPEEQIIRDYTAGAVPQGPEMAQSPEFQGDSYFMTFIDMAQYGSPQPQPALWEPFQDVIVDMVQSALLGIQTPEQAIESASARLINEGLVLPPK